MNSLTTTSYIGEEWFNLLADDCNAIITEAVYNSRWDLVEGYWKLGERIEQEVRTRPINLIQLFADLQKTISKDISTFYRAHQAYIKYPDIQALPEGKNITWNKLITKYLPKSPKGETPQLPEGKYQVICADPPWEVKAGPPWASGEESRDLTYPTMSLEEITSLPVQTLATDDAHLYLWTINKYIPESYAIARAWGFEPSCLLTWVKPPHGIGLGGTFVQTTEHLLFCRKGTLEAKKRIDTTWFQYPRGKHSVKPEEFRKMIEEVSPGKRIELFARIKSDGWDVWGNEV